MNAQFPASAVPLSHKNSGREVARRSANFHPCIWGDFILSCDSIPMENASHEESEHEPLKEEVRNMILAAPGKSLQKLELIDAIQRLGVSYHFENEIDASLKYIYDFYHECFEEDGSDIFAIALRFRLLRQQGHPITCDVFNKFKDTKGKFDEVLSSDVRGILSLYEAAHLRMHGEDILDEALTFTTTHLESMVSNLSNFLAAQVIKALKAPIRLTVPRLGAREYISIYQEDELRNDVLLKFAKLDFNILQKMHQKELSAITRWWKDLDVPKSFPFARDRLVELYYWIIEVYFEPQYWVVRRILTKVLGMTSIIDDIYDVYGTFDELQLFTDVIESWNISASHQLPPYMRHCYLVLLDIYTEIEQELAKQGKSYATCYAIEEMKKLIRAFFEEAKWYHTKYVPKFDEYMKVALVSAAYMLFGTTSFLGMGDLLTQEVLEWVFSEPLIIRSSSVIARLMNDVAGHEFEQERGHVASAVETYMNEYCTSKEVALVEFCKRVTNAWKDINRECLDPIVVPMPFLTRIDYVTRVLNVIYKDDDGYTLSNVRLEKVIYLVLVNRVNI